jgi:flagellar basal body-associated protein FliL
MEFRKMYDPPNDAKTPARSAHSVPAAQTTFNSNDGRAKKSSSKKTRGRFVLWLAVLVVLAAAVATAAYYINRYHDSQAQVKKLASNPTLTAQQEQQQLINKIGTLTVLPKDETPTVATVTDTIKLKDQPFFTNAQNGDKVLIYTQAKQAFLYRPSTNKIINIAPVNLGNNSGTTGTTPSNTTKNPIRH